ncbi:MAG: hypothetical protein U5L11_10070 [Arhodomonas sp.]|nr:hypothetical protein [Arhodomonas sp.]
MIAVWLDTLAAAERKRGRDAEAARLLIRRHGYLGLAAEAAEDVWEVLAGMEPRALARAAEEAGAGHRRPV